MGIKEGKYTFYTDDIGKVIAVSTYEGKVVRGVAKCDPKDSFDIETGKKLAEARCRVKIAKKRYARAKREYNKAYDAYNAASARVDKMNDYAIDSKVGVAEAQEALAKLEKALS